MKKLLPLLFVLPFFSCTRFQYMTISSNETNKNELREFVFENDSIKLVYNFNGMNAPINLQVKNKLDKPVYIDWQRSALVINDKAISYYPSEIPVTGSISASSFLGKGGAYSYASLNATAKLPENIQFIPPQTYITKTPLGVTNKFFNDISDSFFIRTNILLNDGTSQPVKKAVFNTSNSFLKFKTYLTVIIEDSIPHPVAYQQSFFVSELFNTTVNPKKIVINKQGDYMYVRKTTAFGTGFGIVAGIAALTAVAAAEVYTTPEKN